VYDASNRLVAEYSTIVEPQVTAKTSYLTHDHLGSSLITTDALGQVASRRDFMPYGEEIARSGYGQDSVRGKFATYERDTESGLDYSRARYSKFNLGRFQSADRFYLLDHHTDFTATRSHDVVFLQFFTQPQYLNRYVYTVNNPVKFVDIEGLHPGLAAVAVPLVKAAVGGAAIGAVVGGAIEAGKQIYNDGEINNWNAVIQSAGTGAIYGAFVGVAGPVGATIARPVAARVILGGAGSGVAGAGIRAATGQQVTTGDVITDTLAGALGGWAGRVASTLPVLPARVYLPNTTITRAAERVRITRVSFDSQRNLWFNPYGVYGDSLIGNVVRSSTSSGIKKSKEKAEEFYTEVLDYTLYLDR
jgi:RHS repeat-associated protein